ncbi:hypothetical protein HPB48_022192 [Haemaphysalis longicornis]|uniref:Uncharacterized protein n=1 Tax=Haemaphysalis longicornis TaxID=44386 RepID=A0A9J6GHA2_HAELO|nr:hypothetical protein HPB48_022192 [Haemaphysalis longicornis]
MVPRTRGQPSVFALNIYSPPNYRRDTLEYLVMKAQSTGGRNSRVIIGDITTALLVWGYKLHTTTQQHRLTVLTDPTNPTRTGNSITRDTSRNLVLIKNFPQAEWQNLEEPLGSYYYIVPTIILTAPLRRILKSTKMTDWTTFRQPTSQSGTTT